jgi:hypothetical protein
MWKVAEAEAKQGKGSQAISRRPNSETKTQQFAGQQKITATQSCSPIPEQNVDILE